VRSQGDSRRRAVACARQVRHGQHLDRGPWMAPAPSQWSCRYDRRTQTVLWRWQHPRRRRCTYALLLSSLGARARGPMSALDDDRARIDNAINADTGGLLLPRRRQQPLHAQAALVRRTDLAHNIFAWTRRFWAAQPDRGDVGLYCMLHERLTIPGKLLFHDRHLVRWRLQATHPLAKPVLACLARSLSEC
jgi:hypothetical protein